MQARGCMMAIHERGTLPILFSCVSLTHPPTHSLTHSLTMSTTSKPLIISFSAAASWKHASHSFTCSLIAFKMLKAEPAIARGSMLHTNTQLLSYSVTLILVENKSDVLWCVCDVIACTHPATCVRHIA